MSINIFIPLLVVISVTSPLGLYPKVAISDESITLSESSFVHDEITAKQTNIVVMNKDFDRCFILLFELMFICLQRYMFFF